MDTNILPRKLITPTKISEKPAKKDRSFSRITPRNPTDDANLKRLCKLGRLSEAISSLDSCGPTVTRSTFSHLIESCICFNSLDLCHDLHARIKKLVGEPDPFLQTKLVGMFAKCGSLDHAFLVFDEMRQRDLYAWSSMIGACSREKMWGDVVELFCWMMEDGHVVPDSFLFPKILQACGNHGDVCTGRLIHGMVIKLGMSGELRVNNSIIAVYAKCGCLGSAKRFFEGMEVRDKVSWNSVITGYCQEGKINEARELLELMQNEGLEPDVITWNLLISSCNQLGKCDVAVKMMNDMENCKVKPDVYTWTSMISGFAQNNRKPEALKLFREMLISGVEPNDVTIMGALSACSSSAKDIIRKGKEIHLVAIKLGYSENVLVGNSLIDMYSKNRKLESARQVFDIMSERDVYTWNSMIGGYCQAGYCGIAHDLFRRMQKMGVSPNVITWNVMITGYIQHGVVDQAMDLFHEMEKNGAIKRDTASWNALIAGHLHLGQKDKALRIFRKMQSFGIKPNYVTVLSILPACANLIALKKLKEIHGSVIRGNLASEVSIANSLIDTYAKSGNMIYSKAIFNQMPSIDIITWNTAITGYVLHGCFNEAIELFKRMRKLEYRPNRSTFASVISAYGLAKKVDEGKRVFASMAEEFQISPCLDHYVAMVNLYGRSGEIEEAFDFIRGMGIEPDVSIWYAFLTACARHEKVKLAVHAAEKMLQLEPYNGFVLKLVLQLNDFRGISKGSMKIKRAGTNLGKDYLESIGCSWIEDKNIVHAFISNDVPKYLHSWIESVELNLKESKFDNIFRVLEVENEENVGIHSEKQALAFALIKSPSREVRAIRIVKNMRMCDGSHRFAKLVSKTHGCEIYVSDSKCLHHFKEGICSCGDYW